MSEDKRKPGRPTIWKKSFVKTAFKLALAGFSDAKIADYLEVDDSTLNRWKTEYPELKDTLKEAREGADANITKALYDRALGYKHKDVHISNYKGEIRETPIIKHYPPDTRAAEIWLNGRGKGKPDEVPGGDDNEFILKIITPKNE